VPVCDFSLIANETKKEILVGST